MPYGFLDLITSPAIEQVQEQWGSRDYFRDFSGDRAFDRLDAKARAFIAERDTFFIATVSEGGWPYVQHRGGPSGFLKVLDDKTLAFADFRGNQQYLTTGNAVANGKAALILVDFARSRRLKILAEIEACDPGQDTALFEQLIDPAYEATVERAFRLHLEAYDYNCPQHIVPRFTRAETERIVAPLRSRIAQLEDENAALRRGLLR